jgi:hypothetical protein
MPTDVNDRLRDSIREIVKSLLPTIDYHAFYTYVVVSWNNDSQKADLQPFKRPDMPTLMWLSWIMREQDSLPLESTSLPQPR